MNDYEKQTYLYRQRERTGSVLEFVVYVEKHHALIYYYIGGLIHLNSLAPNEIGTTWQDIPLVFDMV